MLHCLSLKERAVFLNTLLPQHPGLHQVAAWSEAVYLGDQVCGHQEEPGIRHRSVGLNVLTFGL